MIALRFSKISGRFEITDAGLPASDSKGTFCPPVDISYCDGTVNVKVDLPGASPEDISIEAGETQLVISGAIQPSAQTGSCRLIERASGLFRRVIIIDGRISTEKIEAHLSNGVLTVKLPVTDFETTHEKIEIPIKGTD
jgi:HSP20 family protein